MAFILPNFKKMERTEKIDQKNWKTMGEWSATADDGFKFALLTGDFNPIHWVGPLAKLSSFGQKVCMVLAYLLVALSFCLSLQNKSISDF